jgi:hypothetical protein
MSGTWRMRGDEFYKKVLIMIMISVGQNIMTVEKPWLYLQKEIKINTLT